MDGHVCIVVPVYVRPMSIVEEQACLGVLIRCPEAGCYAYRLATDDETVKARVLGFFPNLRRATLEQVLPGRSMTSNSPLTRSGKAIRLRFTT